LEVPAPTLHARELEYLLAVSAKVSVYGPETTFAVPKRSKQRRSAPLGCPARPQAGVGTRDR
jgi:hypothetical protein